MKWVNISGGGANSVTKGNFAGDIKLKEGLENNEKNGNVEEKSHNSKLGRFLDSRGPTLKQELDAAHQRLRSVVTPRGHSQS